MCSSVLLVNLSHLYIEDKKLTFFSSVICSSSQVRKVNKNFFVSAKSFLRKVQKTTPQKALTPGLHAALALSFFLPVTSIYRPDMCCPSSKAFGDNLITECKRGPCSWYKSATGLVLNYISVPQLHVKSQYQQQHQSSYTAHSGVRLKPQSFVSHATLSDHEYAPHAPIRAQY